MTYSFGNVVRLNPYFNYKYSDLSAMPREFKNRWTLSGDEAKTNIPAILSNPQYEANRTLYKAYNAYNYSTERIAKGDFIRMKEIIDVQLRTSEHRSMYSYVRLSIDRCTATYV